MRPEGGGRQTGSFHLENCCLEASVWKKLVQADFTQKEFVHKLKKLQSRKPMPGTNLSRNCPSGNNLFRKILPEKLFVQEASIWKKCVQEASVCKEFVQEDFVWKEFILGKFHLKSFYSRKLEERLCPGLFHLERIYSGKFHLEGFYSRKLLCQKVFVQEDFIWKIVQKASAWKE